MLAASVWGFALTGTHWGWFVGLLLVPDLAMFGYTRGPRLGAAVYNAAHTVAAPLALGAGAWAAGWAFGGALALVWTAHIGMDRALGYGLKQPECSDTLGMTGRSALGRRV